MQLLSRKSKLITNLFSLAKNITTFSYEASAHRRQPSSSAPKKAYQKLLSGSDMEQLPKLPSTKLLKNMRTKQISKIMVFNHEVKHQQVLESHIQCYYAIISRFEPSIQGMSLLLQQVYKNLLVLNSQFPEARLQAQNRALIPLMKQSLLKKFVQISQTIQHFYNQYLKMMLSTFIIRAILFSQASRRKKREQFEKLDKLREEVLKGKQISVQGEKLTPEKVKKYFAQKEIELNVQYPTMQLTDFLYGCHYILNSDYYTEEFLQIVVNKLEQHALEDKDDLIITILKLKVIGVLHKFQNFRAVQSKKTELFSTLYNENINRYFNIISDSKQLFQILNSQEHIIQSHLVITEFLTNQHFLRAKEIYFSIFNQIFDTTENGCLMIDIKKIRGVFEIILVMFNYRDTKQIHDFLRKVEKTIILYPFARIERFQTFCYVCEKFGYKSDLVAERYLANLLHAKEKLENLRGIIPHVHQYTRQLNLARKFLTYLQIIQKGQRDQIQLAHKYASQLFDPNIWYCLTQNEANAYAYFNTPSFNSFLYFTKISVNNLTSGYQEKKKIDGMAQKINLRSINKKHGHILSQIQSSMKLTPIKLTHTSFWRHNHHSRMAATLKLAIHNYHYLLRRDHQQASSFLQLFFKKSINTTYFYNAFKQSMAYPGIFDLMLELMQYANSKSFPIQNRDLQALKKLYSKNLQKLKKKEESQQSKETDKIKYREFLDAVEHNRIYLPYNQEYYGLAGITYSLENSLLYDSMIRYKEYKENLRMQIETYCKFRKENEVQVVLNYLQYPHIADVYVKKKERAAVILINITNDPQNSILNYKQVQKQKQAEEFWKKKGLFVIYLKNKTQIQQFVDQKINNILNKLQIQR